MSDLREDEIRFEAIWDLWRLLKKRGRSGKIRVSSKKRKKERRG